MKNLLMFFCKHRIYLPLERMDLIICYLSKSAIKNNLINIIIARCLKFKIISNLVCKAKKKKKIS